MEPNNQFTQPLRTDQETPESAEVPQASEPMIEAPAPPPTPEPNPQQPNKHSLKRLVIIVIIVLLTSLVGLAAAIVVAQHSMKSASVNKTTGKPQVAAAKPVSSQTAFVDNYLETAQPLAVAPAIFNAKVLYGSCSDNAGNLIFCKYTYSKIGSTKAGDDIIVVDENSGNIDDNSYVVLQKPGNKYDVLGVYSGFTKADDENSKALQKALSPSATLDVTTRLPDLKFDQNITVKGVALSSGKYGADSGYPIASGIKDVRGKLFKSLDAANVKKVADYGAQRVYQVTADEGKNYKIQEFYVTVNQVFATRYYLDSPLNADKPVYIKWADESNNNDTFSSHPPGCGSPSGYLVAKNVSDADLTVAGSGPDGTKLYTLATSSPLFQQIYNDDYGNGSSLEKAELKNLSANQYQAKHGLFVTKNSLGENVIYTNNALVVGGGCGKPVVYLYPTKTQNVSVAVGADVQKSEPVYPTGGWKNVVAQPNGSLSYKGATYPNLYWEGVGMGNYPVIDSGTVVAKADVSSTVRKQLAAQGINAQETKDFMDFWQPHFPNTAFVRLTWLTKDQLNNLAPLKISPRPTTTIRVFLDFQGLDRNIALQPQRLAAPQRNGFTAVEWGGLDRSSGVSH